MQAYVDRCFRGLAPADFVACLRILCTETLRPPSGFEAGWSLLGEAAARGEEPWLAPSELDRTSLFLLVSDVSDPEQLETIKAFLQWADTSGESPPVALLPVCLPRRPLREDEQQPTHEEHKDECIGRQEALLRLVEYGIDDIIQGDPIGFELALALRMSFARGEVKTEKIDTEYALRTRRDREKSTLEQTIDFAMWEYAPHKMRMAIPPVDRAVEVDSPDGFRVAGYLLGRHLGRGLSANIYEVEPPEGLEAAFPGGEVLRVMQKSSIKHLSGLVSLHRSFRIMRMLSTDWRHPNIVRLLSIYHSPSNIYFRMERAGSENLYRRLLARDRQDRPLSGKQLAMINQQVSMAIDHMHTGPQICHRDVKPENVVVSGEANEDDITVKLIDFDLAVQSRGSPCRSSCGTFPFVAPEVVAANYDGFMADMWSIGILLLEVVCAVRTLEKRLTAGGWDPTSIADDGPPTDAVQRLAAELGRPGSVREIVLAEAVSEAAPCVDRYADIAYSLLRALPEERMASRRLVEELQLVVA